MLDNGTASRLLATIGSGGLLLAIHRMLNIKIVVLNPDDPCLRICSMARQKPQAASGCSMSGRGY
jgi:hypothetical protein